MSNTLTSSEAAAYRDLARAAARLRRARERAKARKLKAAAMQAAAAVKGGGRE